MPHRYATQLPPHREPDRLVVIAFAEEHLAFSLRELLCELEEDGVLEVGDAVVATRNSKGKVRLHQSIPLISGRAALGAFGGLMMGMLILNPLFGAVAGTVAGAASGVLGDVGIDDAFMKALGETLAPGTSALFVVVRKTKPEELLARLTPFAGKCRVLQSTMTAENETLLRGLLEGALSHPTSEPSP